LSCGDLDKFAGLAIVMTTTPRAQAFRLLLTVSAICLTADLFAGTVNLWGIADGDTKYVEEISDSFIQMDLYDSPPRETQQRFHSIQDPSVTYGSLTYDGFPQDEDFRLGSITYDDTGLTNGTGVAPITSLTLGVISDPADPTYFNYYRWTESVTVVDKFNGTVNLVSGQPTAINLTSTAHMVVTIFAGTQIIAPGTFTITGNRFDGFMEYLYQDQFSFNWDFAGTLTTLSEPPTQPGDFNGDGIVDGSDLLAWQRGDSPSPLSNTDLNAWQANYGIGSLRTLLVPEPHQLAILTLPTVLMALRRSH
jgi:hypothetical protein